MIKKCRVLLVVLLFFLFSTVIIWANRDVVKMYGQLKVVGSHICDSAGNPVQLKGVSSHGMQWFPFEGDRTVKNLVNLLGIDVVRAAMYVKEWDAAYNHYAGYLGSHSWVKNIVIQAVKDAIDEGIYVIVDWHLHWNPYDPANPHWSPDPFTNEAVAFFNEIANVSYNGKLFKDYPNIIWEVMNEPGHGITWSQVKNHANTVINQIRNITGDSDNLILVPPNNWAQGLDQVAWDSSWDRPDRLYGNIAYTLHFYAASHGADVRDKAQMALNNGLAIFASEWGTGDYTGNGYPDFYASDTWVRWLDGNRISWVSWSFSDKNEASALLDPGVGMAGPWNESQLSLSGEWIDRWIGGEPFEPTGWYIFEALHSGKCIEIGGWKLENTANINQYTSYANANQRWMITEVEPGFYKITSKHSGKVLDVAGFSMVNGGNIFQYSYLGGENQKWQILPVGNGLYKILSKMSGKCIDVAGGSYENGANIFQWDYLGGVNQKWRIIRVE